MAGGTRHWLPFIPEEQNLTDTGGHSPDPKEVPWTWQLPNTARLT
jgi:hypothetical protein